MALKASNGRYVSMKKNGQLAACSDFLGEAWPADGRVPSGPGQGRAGRQSRSPEAEPSRGGPPGQDEHFTLKLINRPLLVLRGPDGFVRQRRGSAHLDTNRSAFDAFRLSFSDGAYHIRGGGCGAGDWGAGRSHPPMLTLH